MKTTTLLYILILAVVTFTNAQVQPEPALPHLKHMLSMRDFTLSSNGKEAYFTVQSPLENVAVIAKTIRTKKGWTQPEIVSFSGRFRDLEPFLSPDQLSLYFASNRPLTTESDESKDYDIWVVRRENEQGPWSEPVNIGAPVNTTGNEFYPAISRSGTLYFTSDADASTKDDIYSSKKTKNGFSKPVKLGNSVNTAGYEFNAFVAADESFLIFSGYKRKNGYGSGDLYISYKKSDGSWSQAQNMGPDINSPFMDYCPFVDAENKTLYFTSRRSAIKQQHFSTFKNFQETISQYENGLSRLYKTTFNPDKYTK